MEVLPCGHVAYADRRRVCAHAIGEQADSVDKVWLMRGVGAEYDICCVQCAGTPNAVDLIEACEGCVDDADQWWSIVRVVGTPGVLDRPEPVEASTRRVRLPARVIDIAAIHDHAGEWLLLTDAGLLRWNAATGTVGAQWSIALPSTDSEEAQDQGKVAQVRLHSTTDGRFVAVAVDHGQFGIVVDMQNGSVTMRLDRGTYYEEQTGFPVAFAHVGGRWVLAHATAWNRVDLSDPATGTLLTPRDFPVVEGRVRPEHGLDYFYGPLYPSPDGRWIACDGWVWHPVGVPRLWDLRRWRHEDVYESEDGETVQRLRFVNYHWGDSMCWLDADTLAIGGIGNDDEAMIDGVEIYQAGTGNLLARIAGPAGR